LNVNMPDLVVGERGRAGVGDLAPKIETGPNQAVLPRLSDLTR
jgi:hypothetical protein